MSKKISKNQKKLLSQRWAVLTNPHAGTVESKMTKLSELEVMEHLMTIDLVCNEYGIKPFTDAKIDEARTRFIRFCQTQFDNRNCY